MSSIPVDQLLEPISAEAPSGEDLEYDPAFAEMERAAQGTPEQQYGSTIIEGKEPEWDAVQSAALELCRRTHDLRVAVYLIRAALRTEGLSAFRDALSVLAGFVDKFWDTVHPQLDPDDDLDPTTRVNTLAALCDNATMLTLLRSTPIVSSRAAGRFSRFDLAVATGEIPYAGPADQKPKPALIDAAFQECPLERLSDDAAAMTQAVQLVKQIESSATRAVGAGSMRSLEPFLKEVESIRKVLADRLSRRGGGPSAVEPAAATQTAESTETAESTPVPGTASHGSPPWDGEITSRANAIRAIEKVCRYFERYEPSSPLPLLLHRAVRLSTKSFLEILRDISPDGLTQAETLGGMSSEEYLSQMANSVSNDEPEVEMPRSQPSPPPLNEY